MKSMETMKFTFASVRFDMTSLALEYLLMWPKDNWLQEAEKFVLADSFLPLISIYRASEEVLADAQQFIESPQFRIAFEPLVDSSFILTISDM